VAIRVAIRAAIGVARRGWLDRTVRSGRLLLLPLED